MIESQLSRDHAVALLDTVPDAMICVAADGRITVANSQAGRLFGYQRQELEGQPVEVLIPEAARAGHSQHRHDYLADPVSRPMGVGMRFSGRRRDGSIFPAEISLSAMGTAEGIVVTAAVRDVTERLRQQDELERAYRNLASLAYSLAHDLRTPLRALAGFSAALMADCGDGLGEVGRGYAQRIEAASERMAALLDDLSQLSHVARAKISLRPVDLGAVAARIAEELRRENPGRRVRFTIQQPAWARADRTLVRTVLRSLLDNAWKFTSGRDDAEIEFGARPAAQERVCYVRDNGAGFDFAYVDKLFRPFQRLHTAPEFAGTGAGLAIVQRIVERHGGRTWAEGAVGEGATFYFTLPANGAG